MDSIQEKSITNRIEQLQSSLTGYGLEDSITLNQINRLKATLNGYDQECDDEGVCEMCSG